MMISHEVIFIKEVQVYLDAFWINHHKPIKKKIKKNKSPNILIIAVGT